MRRKVSYDKKVYRTLALITQFGIDMLVPVGALSWLGYMLDRRFGTSFLMILLFFVGAAAGAQNVYRTVKGILEDGERPESRDGDEREDKTD